MSTPPVDPWSTQPEPGSYPPPHQPPPPPGTGPTQAWPHVPQQGGHPGPTQPYGPPADPQPTQQYPAYQSGQAGVHPPAQPGGYPGVQPDGFAGAPAYGLPPAPPPAKKSRLGLILSLVLAGLLVLCAGGGGLAYVALSDDDPDPKASSSPGVSAAPTSAAPEPSPSEEEAEPAPEIRLVTPKTLGGRPKNTEPQLRRIADQMVRDMKSGVRNETGAVGAFYGSAGKRNLVMVAGASGPVLFPEKELDDAVAGLSSSLAVKKMSTVNPGPLGGVAKCGAGKSSDIALGVCTWADEGSVGLIVMFFSSAAKAKAEFATIRGQVEKRS
ncbi:hypothetical protein [Micromonospora purpureochromogenes]|uniref:Flagellar basal body-associated protein FliL n=1 Tax=Micromonospora purpureochromogenes TaxID=47872 RepID=A0ABX2RMF9_9ACTN|nr:hypothetical protein [Micromonospora purpureochromogenes]NYF57725.1 hypothetical protein [Micromonospora purpureochromogenes]